MAEPRDIVVTWPKDRTLARYLEALKQAKAEGAEINFRVAKRPNWNFAELRGRPVRCYRVHDGAVRGYTEILYVIHRDRFEVRNKDTGGFWPAGEYIVCDPTWHPLEPQIPMGGFQGWRYWSPGRR